MAISVAALVLGATGGGPPVLGADPSADDIASATESRSTFGFAHSAEVVRQSFEDPAAYPDDTWGAPLSRDEADEMLRRIGSRTQQRDAVEYARSQADFGGLWFDQRDRGAAHYTFTGDVAEHRREIAALTPDGLDITVSRVDNRMSDLEELKDEVTEDMWQLIDEGFPITMVDANARANRVIVYLEEVGGDAEAALVRRYGDEVTVERGPGGVPDACNNRDDCANPIKGGLRITPSGGSGYCTSAFQASKANGDRVLITAGHCLKGTGGSGVVWTYHLGSRFGVSQGNTLTSSSVAADIGWIKIDSSEDKTPADQFYQMGHFVESFDGQMPDGDQNEGDTVCRSGGHSGWGCDAIVNDDTSKPNGSGQTITHVWSGGRTVSTETAVGRWRWGI
ncbi:MAG: hypothetical protein U0667_18465 [Chloroflexota bacterium]